MAYHFWVTVTLTYDLVFRIITIDRNPKFGVWVHLGMMKCHVPFLVVIQELCSEHDNSKTRGPEGPETLT